MRERGSVESCLKGWILEEMGEGSGDGEEREGDWICHLQMTVKLVLAHTLQSVS